MSFKLPKFLTLNGDGTTINANQNYSVSPARFWLEAEEKPLNPKKLIIEIDDTDSFLNTYGNLSSLTNGVLIQVEEFDGTNWVTTLELTNGVAVHNTLEWSHVGGVLTAINTTTATPGTRVEFDIEGKFSLNPHRGVVSESNRKVRLTVQLSDNFTGLDRHTFLVI